MDKTERQELLADAMALIQHHAQRADRYEKALREIAHDPDVRMPSTMRRIASVALREDETVSDD